VSTPCPRASHRGRPSRRPAAARSRAKLLCSKLNGAPARGKGNTSWQSGRKRSSCRRRRTRQQDRPVRQQMPQSPQSILAGGGGSDSCRAPEISSGVTDGCSRGELRAYQSPQHDDDDGRKPGQNSACCQPSVVMDRRPRAVLPRRQTQPIDCKPDQRPPFPAGNQVSMTRNDGKYGTLRKSHEQLQSKQSAGRELLRSARSAPTASAPLPESDRADQCEHPAGAEALSDHPRGELERRVTEDRTPIPPSRSASWLRPELRHDSLGRTVSPFCWK